MRSPRIHIGVSALAWLLAGAGCLACDDLFTRVAVLAGAVGVTVVLADLYQQPSRPNVSADKSPP